MTKSVCKNICGKYKTTKRYINGAVRCRSCYVFLNWEGIWCPCCKCRISRRPKATSRKARNIEYVRI